MKAFLISIVFCLFATTIFAQTSEKDLKQHIENKTVDIACGECQFKMKGKGCDLAVKIDGHNYFVDGKGIDDFGDAHAETGFCNATRKAQVSGYIVDGRFKAKSIQLLTAKK